MNNRDKPKRNKNKIGRRKHLIEKEERKEWEDYKTGKTKSGDHWWKREEEEDDDA